MHLMRKTICTQTAVSQATLRKVLRKPQHTPWTPDQAQEHKGDFTAYLLTPSTRDASIMLKLIIVLLYIITEWLD